MGFFNGSNARAQVEAELQEYKARQKEKMKERRILAQAREGMEKEKQEKKARRIAKFKKGVKAFGKAIKQQQAKSKAKSRLRSGLGSTSGSRDVFSTGSNIQFGGGSGGPFMSTPKRTPRKRSGKRIIINL